MGSLSPSGLNLILNHNKLIRAQWCLCILSMVFFIDVPPYLIKEINSQWCLEYHLINVYTILVVVTTYFIDGIFIDVPSYLVIESALRGATLASNYVF